MSRKFRDSFKTRKAALEYLQERGWLLSTLFPATGSAVLEYGNMRRGVQQNADGRWCIVRDQATLRRW